VTIDTFKMGKNGAGATMNKKCVSLLLFLVYSASLLSESCAASAGVSVGRWARFEASAKNARTYRNPYADVTLNVTYESPIGKKTKFWGFYDGARTWKIRFMPDRIGTWKYDAVFSDGSGLTSGTFECIPSGIPGMISADRANPMWFGYKSGEHVLIRSFHVGDRFFAENWPVAKRKAFLDWAQTQGYNMLSVASHYLNRDAKDRGRGWKTPDLWPLNAAEYRKAEAILSDLAARKIMAYPFAGFFGQSSDFPVAHQDQILYIKYVLARLGPYWNVLFNVAGPEPKIKPKEFQNAMEFADVNRLGRKIRELDIFGHPISIHNPSGDDPYKNEDWLSFVTLQGWKGTNLSDIYSGMMKNHHDARPLYAQEVFWPGNKYHKIRDKVDIRKKAFVLMMSAAAINYADMNGNSSTGFSGSMDLPDRNQANHDIVRKVWDFFETIPFYRMSPSQKIADKGFCLADEGRRYLVYLDHGATVNVSVQSGRYRVTWINARDTSDRRHAGTTNDGRNLSAPNAGDDWLLLLVAEDMDDIASSNRR
jgi:hypothetical protein